MKISEYHKALAKCKHLKSLESVLDDYLNDLGVTIYSVTYYCRHPNSINKIKYDCCSKRYKIWHQHYLAENYQDIDATLHQEQKQTLPLFWETEKQLKAAKCERERQMRLDSIKFGVEKGLSIPVHGYQEEFANLVVAQMQGETCLENWALLQYELIVAAQLTYHYVQSLLLNSKAHHSNRLLTQREQQCLILVSQQLSVKEIADKLHITPRTVNFHIQRFNKKLGVKNKHQAVTKAFEKNIIL